MGIIDYESKGQVKYKKETCFRVACEILRKLDGFSVDKEDKVSTTIYLKGGMTLFSWGEIVTVTITSLSNGYSEINVCSTPKTGFSANAPGIYGDMGKNKKNIVKIQNAITEELGKYPEDAEIISVTSSNVYSAADEILKLKKLLDEGILTKDEFDAKKRQLLGI